MKNSDKRKNKGFIQTVNTQVSEKIVLYGNKVLSNNKLKDDLQKQYNISQASLKSLMIKYRYIENASERKEMAERDREQASMKLSSLISEGIKDNKIPLLLQKKVDDYIRDELSKMFEKGLDNSENGQR